MQKPNPIAFETKEDFQNRPHYQAKLTCAETELDYIVGKYHFSKERKLQCGLNNCNQWHQMGFVIATNSRSETHCGHRCGAKAFGVAWLEVEAEFKKQEEANNRLASLQRIKDEAKTALNRCSELSALCKPLANQISKIAQEMAQEEAFKNALEQAIKIEGKIFGKAERSAFMSNEASKTIVVATIEGGEAFSASVSIMKILRFQVKNPLNELLEKNLESLTAKEIEKELSSLKNYTATLLQAETFIRNATRFTATSNLQKFKLLIDGLTTRNRTDRVHRIAARICTI